MEIVQAGWAIYNLTKSDPYYVRFKNKVRRECNSLQLMRLSRLDED